MALYADYDILVPYESDLVRENLLDRLTIRSDFRHDLLNRLMRNDLAVKSQYVQVPHKVAPFQRTTLNTAINTSTNADTSIVLDNSALTPVNVKTGTILRIDSEYFEVKEEPVVTSSTITCSVRRGTNVFSSTAATHSAAANVYLESKKTSDAVQFDRSEHIVGERQVTVTEQVVGFELEIADNASAIAGNTVAGDNSIEAQMDMGINIALDKLLRLAWRRTYGAGSPSNSTTSIGDQRTMRGVVSWLSTYNGIVNSASSADITTDHIDSDLSTAIDRGLLATYPGSRLVMGVSTTQKMKINRFLGSRLRVDQSEEKVKNYVTSYESEVPLDIMLLPPDVILPDEYFIFSPDQISIVPLSGRAFKEEDLAKTGATQKKWIIGEYTCIVQNPELMVRRHTLKTT